MHQILRALPFLAVLVLAGCSSMGSTQDIGPTLARPNPTLSTASLQPPVAAPAAPAEATATARSLTDVAAFIDPAALGLLSEKDKAAASTAQFYALEVGRVGAPRVWQGDSGHSGSIVVGPNGQANNLRCRDFTNTVTIDGREFVRRGNACREADGRWWVVEG
jgi:surface antigen